MVGDEGVVFVEDLVELWLFYWYCLGWGVVVGDDV